MNATGIVFSKYLLQATLAAGLYLLFGAFIAPDGVGPGPGPAGSLYPQGSMSPQQYRRARHTLRAAEKLLTQKPLNADSALALLNDSIPLIPMGSNARYHRLKGRALLMKGDTAAAMQHLEAAIRYGGEIGVREAFPFDLLAPKDSARLAYLSAHADSLQRGYVELDIVARLDSLDRADQALRRGYGGTEYPALREAVRRNEAYIRHLYQNDPKGFPSALRTGEECGAMFMILIHASDSFRQEFLPIMIGLALQNKVAWQDVETLYEPLSRGGSETFTFNLPTLLEFTPDGHIASTIVNDFILNNFVSNKVLGCYPDFPENCDAFRKYNGYARSGREIILSTIQYRGEDIAVAKHHQPALDDLYRYLTDDCHMNPEAIHIQPEPQWIELYPSPGAAHIGVRFLMPSEYK
jgi:hypothetical protein